MKVLAISGSPRREGFTNRLLKEAVKGARSMGVRVETVFLNDLRFKPCQECAGCDETGICVLNDDLRGIYKKLTSYERIILSSPIFFGSISAQLKMMIDRCQSLWAARYLLGKKIKAAKKRKGVFISTAGRDDDAGFENARQIVNIFFTILDMEYNDELFVAGMNKMQPSSPKTKAALKEAFLLGASLVKT